MVSFLNYFTIWGIPLWLCVVFSWCDKNQLQVEITWIQIFFPNLFIFQPSHHWSGCSFDNVLSTAEGANSELVFSDSSDDSLHARLRAVLGQQEASQFQLQSPIEEKYTRVTSGEQVWWWIILMPLLPFELPDRGCGVDRATFCSPCEHGDKILCLRHGSDRRWWPEPVTLRSYQTKNAVSDILAFTRYLSKLYHVKVLFTCALASDHIS
jgi:hypothetical protein